MGSLESPEWSPDGRLYVTYLRGNDPDWPKSHSNEEYPYHYYLEPSGYGLRLLEMKHTLGGRQGLSGMRVSADGLNLAFTYLNRLYVAQASSGLAKPVAMHAARPVFVWANWSTQRETSYPSSRGVSSTDFPAGQKRRRRFRRGL
jgi:hypothetical protein